MRHYVNDESGKKTCSKRTRDERKAQCGFLVRKYVVT